MKHYLKLAEILMISEVGSTCVLRLVESKKTFNFQNDKITLSPSIVLSKEKNSIDVRVFLTAMTKNGKSQTQFDIFDRIVSLGFQTKEYASLKVTDNKLVKLVQAVYRNIDLGEFLSDKEAKLEVEKNRDQFLDLYDWISFLTNATSQLLIKDMQSFDIEKYATTLQNVFNDNAKVEMNFYTPSPFALNMKNNEQNLFYTLFTENITNLNDEWFFEVYIIPKPPKLPLSKEEFFEWDGENYIPNRIDGLLKEHSIALRRNNILSKVSSFIQLKKNCVFANIDDFEKLASIFKSGSSVVSFFDTL